MHAKARLRRLDETLRLVPNFVYTLFTQRRRGCAKPQIEIIVFIEYLKER
jgi:hypothetical protein